MDENLDNRIKEIIRWLKGSSSLEDNKKRQEGNRRSSWYIL